MNAGNVDQSHGPPRSMDDARDGFFVANFIRPGHAGGTPAQLDGALAEESVLGTT